MNTFENKIMSVNNLWLFIFFNIAPLGLLIRLLTLTTGVARGYQYVAPLGLFSSLKFTSNPLC